MQQPPAWKINIKIIMKNTWRKFGTILTHFKIPWKIRLNRVNHNIMTMWISVMKLHLALTKEKNRGHLGLFLSRMTKTLESLIN